MRMSTFLMVIIQMIVVMRSLNPQEINFVIRSMRLFLSTFSMPPATKQISIMAKQFYLIITRPKDPYM